MSFKTQVEKSRALLVSIKTPDITEAQAAESLAELERLVTTLGFTVFAKESQKQGSTSGPTAVGAGKLADLAKLTCPEETADSAAEHANVVVFDCELKPSQLRNIEIALKVEVLDRTGVIIEIFSRHAKTRAAKLQVEIARLNYLSPRLRETGSSGERQSGRGSGESALETGRRNVRDQLAELKRELAALQLEQENHRKVRSDQPCVALVGYTNAGKSSLMRALTGSDVLVQDKLFATLDTTVRALKPETIPRILISDTVGFIKKLPHDLVASFRSTLDEAANASLLLYVVDASDPSFRSQLEVVEQVLKEVGVSEIANVLVLNKSDQLDEVWQKRLKREFPNAIMISTLAPNDIKQVWEYILVHFEQGMIESDIFVPYGAEGAVGEIRSSMRVIEEKFEAEGTRFKVRSMSNKIEQFKKRFAL
jgi:GTP-binding protein HflX